LHDDETTVNAETAEFGAPFRARRSCRRGDDDVIVVETIGGCARASVR